jgi:hypothetical protein
MNTGQMFLTLGAIMLFGIQVLRVNTSELSAADEVSNAKFSVMGVALARSRIDRAFALKFDANTVSGNAVPDASGNPSSGSFTAATGLGPADNEKTSGKADEAKFNDFDDYHNFASAIDTLPSARYVVTSQVWYVNPKVGFAKSTVPTWDKQITVTVTSPNLQAPIILSAISSYWRYN